MTFEPFDLHTPGLRRLYQFELEGEGALLIAEIRRTLEALAAAAPARIAKGQLSNADANRQQAPWLAIAADLEEQARWYAEGAGMASWSLADRLRELGAASGVTWQTKVDALRREITARRTGYPADVAKGRLTSAQARAQLERLEAVHDFYWRHGYAFDGTREELRELSEAVSAAIIDQQGIAA